MIIEGAFLKIPEILINHSDPDLLYEANITNLFTNAVILELNARNIDNPLMKIHMEKRYSKNENIRCDIYMDFSSFINDEVYKAYEIKSKNWIEAKYFGGINRNKGSETKSENAGSIIYDMFRLIYYNHNNEINEEKHGKYSLNMFNDNPQKYLAYSRKNGEPRTWIKSFLSSGVHELNFDLLSEPNSIRRIFVGVNDLKMKLKIRNTIFEPIIQKENYISFYGYLSQIIDYQLIVDGKNINKDGSN
ncbi:hypothetical protein [Fusibacter ferrireducens]|uniref:Uncharacterized protein n=1 Tax=Fusibacter ferrireducens TaxID=2785058 RepID=A0ABS0A017_9FIRM|nr:hypothetical protein [Fusibacter ferrireducens]MBF4696040.1 hypothetical protein [Fusibacter ferrireducens]